MHLSLFQIEFQYFASLTKSLDEDSGPLFQAFVEIC